MKTLDASPMSHTNQASTKDSKLSKPVSPPQTSGGSELHALKGWPFTSGSSEKTVGPLGPLAASRSGPPPQGGVGASSRGAEER